MIKQLTYTLLFMPFVCLALNSDSTKVAHIRSDSFNYNNKTGVAKYIGHVHAKQGTTTIDADNVTLYRNAKQKIEKIIALGNPAHYTTLPDHEKKYLHASAKRIEYHPITGKMILIKNGFAKMGNNSFSGEHIIYDTASETIVSLPNEHSQTHIVIEPEKKAEHNA